MRTDLLTSRLSLHMRMRALRPRRIVVAYVGIDWPQIIDRHALEEIILSPTLGSSPDAIAGLVKQLLWDRVHFLDELHAKIYLGARTALVGSPNLSHHALGCDGTGLHEIGILTNSASQLKDLRQYVDELVAMARRSYPTSEAKMRRLQLLRVQRKQAARAGLLTSTSRKNAVAVDYRIGVDQPFDIVWYQLDEVGEKNNVISRHVPNWANIRKECSQMHFTNSDDLSRSKWILVWQMNDRGLASRRTRPSWFRIDYVVPNATREKEYSQLALYHEERKTPGEEPFPITPLFAATFAAVINHPKYLPLRLQDDPRPWVLTSARRLYTPFMREVQKTMRAS